MREERGFAEPLLARGSDHLRRYARQCGERRHIRTEGKRDEGRARFDDPQAEPARDIIGKAGRAHFGDGGAACRNHERGGGKIAAMGVDDKAVVTVDAGYMMAGPDVDTACRALRSEEHTSELQSLMRNTY